MFRVIISDFLDNANPLKYSTTPGRQGGVKRRYEVCSAVGLS